MADEGIQDEDSEEAQEEIKIGQTMFLKLKKAF
jgi:hypothetical protein